MKEPHAKDRPKRSRGARVRLGRERRLAGSGAPQQPREPEDGKQRQGHRKDLGLARKEAPAPGRREAGKSERKARIVRAARELIEETGDAGLSMRALAARAGVSLATPYNLFGSKRAILVAVLDDIKGFYERFAVLPPSDALCRILDAIGLSISYYEADPRFYRVIWSTVLSCDGGDARLALWNEKRAAFWLGLLQDAAAAGFLSPAIDLDCLMRNLDFTFRSVMLHWVFDDLSTQELQPAAGYGFALALKGAALRLDGSRLDERLLAFQAQLAAQKLSEPGATHRLPQG